MNQTSNFQVWIDKGDNDLSGAKLMFLHQPGLYDLIAFHCQQSVEKYIKAYLVKLNIEFLYRHDLVYLLDLIPENLQFDESYYEFVYKLESFSVQIRYPDNIIIPSKEQLQEAIEIAEKFREFIISKINQI